MTKFWVVKWLNSKDDGRRRNNTVGYTGYIFTGNLNLVKKVGLRTQSRTTFYNGKIECRLLEYQLYKGSLKKGK